MRNNIPGVFIKILCIVFETIKFKALSISLYGNRSIIYGCLSHRTREQFFYTRCIYALLLPHCHKQNMFIRLPFSFMLCRVFKASKINSSNKESLLSIILCVLRTVDFICLNENDTTHFRAN